VLIKTLRKANVTYRGTNAQFRLVVGFSSDVGLGMMLVYGVLSFRVQMMEVN